MGTGETEGEGVHKKLLAVLGHGLKVKKKKIKFEKPKTP